MVLRRVHRLARAAPECCTRRAPPRTRWQSTRAPRLNRSTARPTPPFCSPPSRGPPSLENSGRFLFTPPQVQTADPRQRDDVARARRFHGPRDRRIAAKRHMGSVLVVVGDMVADQAEQMPLSEHDDVVEQFSAQRADPPFGEPVLPRGARRGPELLDAQIFHARVKRGPEDRITVSNQPHRRDVSADGLHDLLCRPCGVRMRRHVDVQHTAALEREDKEDVDDVECDRRHRQKSGSPGGYPPGPPQIRTCATRASGSSEVGFATCTGGRCAAAAEGTSSTADSSATS